jgi:protein O-mannosyl-transferase
VNPTDDRQAAPPPIARGQVSPRVVLAPVTAPLPSPAWPLAVLLALATVALYWPATRCDFINLDDHLYVTSNVHVQSGLTLEGINWVFCNPVACNWHPLTMLSHMMDCQLFGLKPWGHHLTSVLLHALNTALVFLLLRRLTGAVWRSALVAAVFGLHPLHVESVVWVSERKDVLSTCFGLLSLVFYARYAQGKASVENPGKALKAPALVSHAWVLDYSLALLILALGLMSKAMLVTWPFVMLLLDYWPLNRLTSDRGRVSRQGNWRRLLWEKLPFFALAAAASVATLLIQEEGGAFAAGEQVPFGWRSANALISYCRYIGKLLWPTHLAVFYPHPSHWPMETVLLAGVLVVGISVLLMVGRQRYPFLLMGWLWFCGTLVPVIGLVQVGGQAMADRYSYIPSLGLLILAIWGAYRVAGRWRHHLLVLSAAGAATSVLCIALTRQQLGYWQDSEALSRHALEVTENNPLAHKMLGDALLEKGHTDEAIKQFQQALHLKPDYPDARSNLGSALVKKGLVGEAISQYREVLRLEPRNAEACYNLGNALEKIGQMDEAISQYRETLRLQPNDANVHNAFGNALARIGQTQEAIGQFQEAVRLNPVDAKARNNLGTALGLEGHVDEAISQLREAVRLKPDDAEAHNNLGNAFVRKGQLDEAISQFQNTVRLNPDAAGALNYLGYLWTERGEHLNQARVMLERAVRLEPKNPAFLDSLGWVLFKLNHPQEGLDYLLQAVENARNPSAALYDHLGDVYATLGQRGEATQAWRKSLSIAPSRETERKLGDASVH